MDVENTRTSLNVATHEVSLTAKAELAAKKLHKHEAEVSQYVRGAVEVRNQLRLCQRYSCLGLANTFFVTRHPSCMISSASSSMPTVTREFKR